MTYISHFLGRFNILVYIRTDFMVPYCVCVWEYCVECLNSSGHTRYIENRKFKTHACRGLESFHFVHIRAQHKNSTQKSKITP